MEPQAPQLTLGLLPAPRTPWERFVFSYGVQTLLLAFFIITALIHPEVLVMPIHDYHFVHLVETPAPVPQQPQPVRHFQVAKVELPEPRPDALRVPKELIAPKKQDEPAVVPQVKLSAKMESLPDAKAVMPRQMVKTNVFSTGSSAIPTIAAAPQKVQTGGFGDPNGVPVADNHGRPITISQRGSFDMPGGPGNGNGTGGAKGVPGVITSAGFGNGVAIGDNSGKVSASRGTVREGGFGDADVIAKAAPKSTIAAPAAKTIAAEITYKPRPVYTDEGRRLKIEGEVLLEAVFTTDGQVRVLRVVRGLGHGLDESAIQAAQKIQFKPALQNGQPVDFQAVLHIVFELAS